MADSICSTVEVRFDVRDEQVTHCYALVMAGYDAPIGVQGWHYKAFPARIPTVQILAEHFGDHLLWPLKAPGDTIVAENDKMRQENMELRLRLDSAERQTQIPDLVIDGYVNYVNLSKMIGNPVMPFSHWLAEGDKEP